MNATRFDHSLPADGKIVDRDEYLIKCSTGKKVLHLGCVDTGFLDEKIRADEWLHKKIVDIADNVIGLDNNIEGINQIKEIYPDMKFIAGNVEELDQIVFEDAFDIIIAGDIIEHLANVGKFLYGIRHIMSHNTTFILTTPNAFRYQNLVLSLFKKESIHPDHNYWFSWNSLSTVLAKFDLHIEKSFMYNIYPKVVFKRRDNIIRTIQKGGFGIVDMVISKLVIPFVPFWADGLIAEVKKCNNT